MLVILVSSSSKLQNLVTFASSNGASTSSKTQIGEGFTKNTEVKIAGNKIQDFDYKTIQVEEFPSLVLFENKEVKKVITGKENILKLVKTWNFDINGLVETL